MNIGIEAFCQKIGGKKSDTRMNGRPLILMTVKLSGIECDK